jgi:hypothetical protein
MTPAEAARFAEITAAMRSEATARCELRAHSIAGLDYESDTCAMENAVANAWPLTWEDCIIPESSCPTPLPSGGDSATGGAETGFEETDSNSVGSGYDESSTDETAVAPPLTGPEVYGLASWDGVIECESDGSSCRIDEAFVEALLFNPLVVTNDELVVVPQTTRDGRSGYALVSFSAESLAAALSFEEGDVIVEVGGLPISHDPLKLLELLGSKPTVMVEVVDRRGHSKTRAFHSGGL